MDFCGSDNWTILSSLEQSIKRKIEQCGKRLCDWDVDIYRGILTGYNDAFIISGEKKDALIAEDPRSAEIIRPILRGRDIKRYGATFADLWLLNVHNGVKDSDTPRIHAEDFPAIKAHLDMHYEKLAKRSDKGDTPYNLRNCAYMDDFSKPKIVYAETMRVHRNDKVERFPRFSFIEQETFLDKTCFMITGNHLPYILSVINSALMQYHIQRNIAVLDTGGFLMQKIYVEDFPIPPIEDESYKILTELSAEILAKRAAGEDTKELEELVDLQVYTLFNLSEAEVRYIEAGRIGGA